jgi:hypothetical protein
MTMKMMMMVGQALLFSLHVMAEGVASFGSNELASSGGARRVGRRPTAMRYTYRQNGGYGSEW